MVTRGGILWYDILMNEYIAKNHQLVTKVIAGLAVLIGLSLFVSVMVKVKQYRYIGNGVIPSATITVSGKGHVEKAPDTAKFSFTIEEKAKQVADAQAAVSKKITDTKNALIAAGVDEKYITTESYASYPNYEYTQIVCTVGGCPPAKAPILHDYTVSQNVKVDVKDLSKVEAVVGILGKQNVTNMSGPSFGFEDDKAVTREARDLAIADARSEALKLASALNVRLVRVVSFADQSGGGYPVAYMAKAVMMDSAAAIAPAPSIPTGVQSVDSNVSVTYEIR